MLLLLITAAHAEVLLTGSVEDVVAQARARGIEIQMVPSPRAVENRRAARWEVELRFPDDAPDWAIAAAVGLAAHTAGYCTADESCLPRLRIDLEPVEALDAELKLDGSLSAELAAVKLRELSGDFVVAGRAVSIDIDRRARRFRLSSR